MQILSRFFATRRKARAIASYVRVLPRLMVRDYGYAEAYTPAQVRRTIERSGLSAEFYCYGLAMFADREMFDQFHAANGEVCDFDAMRAEIAERHFAGDVTFTPADMDNWMSDGGHSHAADLGMGHHGSHDAH